MGFYLLKDGELVVGPFQGKPACVRIALGKGVCGTAAARRATVIVKNVHEFAGHIACDSASNSEIVVPLVRGNELIGVLDLDSPKFAPLRRGGSGGIGESRRRGAEGDCCRSGFSPTCSRPCRATDTRPSAYRRGWSRLR